MHNTLSDDEKENGWMLLFDGETPGNWRGFNKDHFPVSWGAEEGSLHIKGQEEGYGDPVNGGDILYPQKFSNFHLKLEWKVAEGGNSGIFYLGYEGEAYNEMWKTALEMQVLDNENYPDPNLSDVHKAGALYDLIPAVPQNALPGEEWNQAEIIVSNALVCHIMNGDTVVRYKLWSDDWYEMVSKSKFPEYNKNWANVAREGYIGLQDHGDDAWFRDIKIKEL